MSEWNLHSKEANNRWRSLQDSFENLPARSGPMGGQHAALKRMGLPERSGALAVVHCKSVGWLVRETADV